MRIWSHYSEALFERYLHTQDNIIVQAAPGAGKTTNAEHIWGLDGASKVYLVFNKHNQLEAQSKLRAMPGSDVLTLNGLGHRAVMATFGTQVPVDRDKVRRIIRRTMSETWMRELSWKGLPSFMVREREWMLVQAVDKAKICDLGQGMTQEAYESMLSTYDLESYEGMQEDTRTILDISDGMVDVIDFNDQIRLPALYQCTMPQYDVVIGDEVQDFSPIQALMVSRLGAQRYVFIGDKRQSIYGFRGAMLDSMEYLTGTFHCKEMPLSISYRCAQRIVEQARTIWPEIEPWSQSPQGAVYRGYAKDDYGNDLSMSTAVAMQPDTLILCRNNAPLVSLAFDLLREGIACHVRGRDIGNGLISLIHKMECTTVRDLIDALTSWRELECAKAQAKEDMTKEQSINDKFDTTMIFINKCGLKDEPSMVITHIEDMFAQGRGICLSTVHKAKGLEAQQCFMLASALHGIYADRAMHAWQAEQEKNIKYVAVTRAKSTLVYM